MNNIQKQYNLSLLYVEDDPFILQNAIEFLNDLFLEVYGAKDGKEALDIYHAKNPDIIITDIDMPHLSGLELCKKIRKDDDTTPIIITTAFANQEYLLEAIELNLVKYLIKPIQEDELLEALKSAAHKLDKKEKSIITLADNLYFDTFNYTLKSDDELIKLSSNEIAFLKLLLKNKHRIISYKEIENFVWDGEYMSEDALKSLVKNLRKKTTKELIQNHSKIGYRINLPHG